MEKISLGKLGEQLGQRFLKKRGYRILETNFFYFEKGIKRGEIDIIALKNNTYHFLEVKTGSSYCFLPEERIDKKKKRALVRTALFWLASHNKGFDCSWQIDILRVIINKKKKAKIFHFKNVIS